MQGFKPLYPYTNGSFGVLYVQLPPSRSSNSYLLPSRTQFRQLFTWGEKGKVTKQGDPYCSKWRSRLNDVEGLVQPFPI
jgi:hypothetical protein